MKNNAEQNFYDLLDIDSSATLEEIQRAYREAKQTYSSDSPALYSMFSQEEAQQINMLLDEAYQTLSHYAHRREYDEKLRGDYFEIIVDKKPPQSPSQEVSGLQSKSLNQNDNEINKENMARTKFGAYEKDHLFEEEIENQTQYDGSFLEKIRKYKRVDIHILSEHLKISKHHFKAIEANDFLKLPANVFVRSYVKQYAESLNLDATKVCDSYMKLLKEVREK